jgi:hypothetical protein
LASEFFGLTDVFHVAGDTVIDRVSLVVEGAIVMPAGVAVSVKGFADNRAGQVGVTV